MRIMMFAHGGSLNRGCEAIVRSTTSLIKEHIDQAKVYLISGKPESDQIIHKLDGIYDGTDQTINKYSLDWFKSAVRYKLFNSESYSLGKIHNNIIKHIKDMDVCLSIGGDNYCYGEQPGWYEVDRRVKQQGKKLVLWGCSIGDEDLSEQKLNDLKRFDLILARETMTYDILRSKGLHQVKLCADPAFTMEKEELPLPDGWQERNMVGLNYSPLVWNKNKQSKAAMRSLIDHIIRTTDLNIAFTPHVIQENNNDYEILKEFYEEFKDTQRVLLLPDNLNAIQYKGYIARMRFFVGARTHATIAAYSSFVPTMVLGYSIKSKGIAKDLFGEEKLVLRIDQLSDEKLLKQQFEYMLQEEDSLKIALQQKVPEIQNMSYKAVEYLKELS